MTGLETAFYTIGIIFMSIMLLLGLVMSVAVLVIRAKINAIHARVEERIGQLENWAEKGGALVGAIKKVAEHTKK